MASGFLENSSDVAMSNHDYATNQNYYGGPVVLTKSSLVNALSLPTGMVNWSHVELTIEHGANTTGVTNAQVKMLVTWDSAGDDVAAGPSQSFINLVQARTDTDKYICSAVLNVCPSLPSDGNHNNIYLWLQTRNLGTDAVVKRARLFWHDFTKG